MAEVKDSKFVIGNATVMMAPFSSDVYTLNPDDHTVGMVKAVTLEMQADQITLRNGIQQLQVDSQRSNVNLTSTFEGYEFSATNLMYALGLQGTVARRLRGALTVQADPTETSLTIASSPVPGDPLSLIDAVGDLPSGAMLLLQDPAQPDNVFPVRTTAIATGAGPYVSTVAALPAGVVFPIGSYVWVVNEIDVGSLETDEFFAVKIVGTLSANNEPIVVVMPKVRVTRGFNLSFSETDYSNLPFELSPLLLSNSEVAARPEYDGFQRTIARAYAGG